MAGILLSHHCWHALPTGRSKLPQPLGVLCSCHGCVPDAAPRILHPKAADMSQPAAPGASCCFAAHVAVLQGWGVSQTSACPPAPHALAVASLVMVALSSAWL